MLDRIAIGLPSKAVLPAVLQYFESNITHESHAYRAAACTVLGTVAEGCGAALRQKGRIARSVPLVTRCVGDAHARVRAAAASCIGEMACALPLTFANVVAMHACIVTCTLFMHAPLVTRSTEVQLLTCEWLLGEGFPLVVLIVVFGYALRSSF